VPGTGREDEICQHFDSGIAKVPGNGRRGGTGRGGEICQHSDPGIAKVPGTGRGGEICQHFDSGSQRCLAPGAGAKRRVLAGLVKSPNRMRWLAHG
jgi:hypothetical protein